MWSGPQSACFAEAIFSLLISASMADASAVSSPITAMDRVKALTPRDASLLLLLLDRFAIDDATPGQNAGVACVYETRLNSFGTLSKFVW